MGPPQESKSETRRVRRSIFAKATTGQAGAPIRSNPSPSDQMRQVLFAYVRLCADMFGYVRLFRKKACHRGTEGGVGRWESAFVGLPSSRCFEATRRRDK